MAENPITPEVMRLSNEAVDAEILKSITEYAELDRQSEKITAKRTKIRTKMEKDHGYSSLAFQEVVRKVKKMTAEERLAHEEQVARGLRVAGVLKQAELWPEMAKKADARKAKREKKAAKEAAAAATKTAEDIERGDPKRGGAGGANGRGKAKDAPTPPKRGGRMTAAERAAQTSERNQRLAETKAASPGATADINTESLSPVTIKDAAAASDAALAESIAAAEQKTGGDILDGALEQMKGKPKSQSEIAQERVDAAMSPGKAS